MKKSAVPWPSAQTRWQRKNFPFARVEKLSRDSLPAALCKPSSRATVEGSRCASLKVTSAGSLDFARDDEVGARDQLTADLAQINFFEPASLLRLAKLFRNAVRRRATHRG